MNIGYLCYMGKKSDFHFIKDFVESLNTNYSISEIFMDDMLLQNLESKLLDVLFIDFEYLTGVGMEVVSLVKNNFAKTDVVLMDTKDTKLLEAFRFSVDGFLVKPFTESTLQHEIEKSSKKRMIDKKNIFIKTFGYFDIFVNGDAVHFSNSKSKEFLAILVDRCGGTVDMDQAITFLWPEREMNNNVKSRYRNMLKELREELIESGIYEIISEKRNSRSINRSKFQCDYYRLLTGDMNTIQKYNGEYMKNYSWSENTLASIEKIVKKYK